MLRVVVPLHFVTSLLAFAFVFVTLVSWADSNLSIRVRQSDAQTRLLQYAPTWERTPPTLSYPQQNQPHRDELDQHQHRR